MIHHVRSVTCDFENVHRTICAAKHKRHPISEKDNPATNKGPQISESAYKKKLQGILSTFIARLEESAEPLTKIQTAVLKTIGELIIECSINLKYCGTRSLENQMFMVLGLPGVGKTTITMAISSLTVLLGAGVMVSSARTGVAAALLMESC